ncbi:MAG: DUF4236 domain-containing protein [Hoeflea sp.]|nr:DUF4236 domain-containing protein [Hoeflea sp.]
MRFRKSLKIAPGIRINLSRSGPSLSVGGRGATANFSKRGTRTTLGIPGTGLSFVGSPGGSSQAAVRRAEREDRAILRAEALSRIQVSVDDSGALTCLGADGVPLKGRELTLAWDQHGQAIRTLLQDAIDKINGDVALLDNIFHDAPFPTPNKLLDAPPFTEPRPIEPDREPYPGEPKLTLPQSPGFISRLFGGARRYERRLETVNAKYHQECSQHHESVARIDNSHQAALDGWRQASRVWESAREAHNAQLIENERLHRSRLSSDEDYATAVIEQSLDSLDWPRETLVSFEVARERGEVWLDVDLPELEDFPARVATLAASGKRLNIKAKPQATLRSEYARHIHGILLRLASVVASTLPWSTRIIISGYSQRLDSATGRVNDDYLVSVVFTRDGLEQIDYRALEAVDPIVAVAAFESRRQMSATGMFKPIEPYRPDEH